MNRLIDRYPEICKEWDYDKNDKFPSDYLPFSNKRVSWICEYGHKWDAIISNRTAQNNNCPICNKNESWCENYIFSGLSQILNVRKHNNPEIDIYLEDLNIGIEYDGYYHKFRYDLDIRKNNWSVYNLKNLIRIREVYLPELPKTENLIIIYQKDSSRESCKKSLIKILKILKIKEDGFNFDFIISSKIRNYNIPKDIELSWSPNNKDDIKKAMKTHKHLWLCDNCNSEYSSSLRDRLRGVGCPYCASQMVNDKNCISRTHNYLLKYISPLNSVDPNKVTFGTGQKMKFILNSKEYYTTPRNFNRCIKR